MNKIKKLIDATIKSKDKLSYINLDNQNNYLGWVNNFNIILPNGRKMCLDLSKEEDLFLLFVLASSWSKSGAWENAAFFTSYLSMSRKTKPKLWLDPVFVSNEAIRRKEEAWNMEKKCTGLIPRKKVSFRRDYYPSLTVLAKNWPEIKRSLETSNANNNYKIFIDYISQLDGLGAGRRRMRIKIPLILREMRCQKVYQNIPGELCCVPDERVRKSSKEIGIQIPNIYSIDSLFKASKIIYENFGDLYDIPLFAYEDITANKL